MIRENQVRIASSATTTIIDSRCLILQIVIACANAGTGWTLKIQDKAGTPNILIPPYTLTVPADGIPTIINFETPVTMEGGIDIITAGTAGVVSVWLVIQQ